MQWLTVERRCVVDQVSCVARCCRCGRARRCWWTVIRIPGGGGRQLVGWMCVECRAFFGLRSA